MGEAAVDTGKLDALIAEAKASGGSELANYQLFVLGLCEALALDRPAMAREENDRNDYVFERRVDFKHPDGSRTAGRIDCYRRGSFILEAKQSAKRQGTKVDPDQMLLLPEDAMQRKPGQAKRGTRGWDQVMLAARKQAEDYARALPVEHGYGTIRQQDAVVVSDRQELLRDASGRPLSRWDGVTKKLHPITGEEIPDPDATVELYSYVNPKRAPWPEVEFVVGNPPFIGGKDSPGVKLHGAGFIVTPAQARSLGLGSVEGLDQHILDYRNGRDIAQRPRGVMVIDLYPLEIEDVRARFPAVYQHVLERVKPERDNNREEFRREFWWWFGRRHTDLREFLAGLPRYIATAETTRHRTFQFLDASIRPDNMLVCISIGSARTALPSSRG